jgi:hypothetical protein
LLRDDDVDERRFVPDKSVISITFCIKQFQAGQQVRQYHQALFLFGPQFQNSRQVGVYRRTPTPLPLCLLPASTILRRSAQRLHEFVGALVMRMQCRYLRLVRLDLLQDFVIGAMQLMDGDCGIGLRVIAATHGDREQSTEWLFPANDADRMTHRF